MFRRRHRPQGPGETPGLTAQEADIAARAARRLTLCDGVLTG